MIAETVAPSIVNVSIAENSDTWAVSVVLGLLPDLVIIAVIVAVPANAIEDVHSVVTPHQFDAKSQDLALVLPQDLQFWRSLPNP